MFDFSKFTDMAKLAQEAKKTQSQLKSYQDEQLSILRKISSQLAEIISLLKEKNKN